MIDHDRLAMIGDDNLGCSKSLASDVPIQPSLEFQIRYQLKSEEREGRKDTKNVTPLSEKGDNRDAPFQKV